MSLQQWEERIPGANPLSTLLSALAGCENVIANLVAREIEFDLQGIEFNITGILDTRGLMGNANVQPYFEKVRIESKVKTSETQERVYQLQKITDARCPVFTTFKAAGIELEVNWAIEQELIKAHYSCSGLPGIYGLEWNP